MKRMKKIIAILLSLIMLVMPFSVSAETLNTDGEISAHYIKAIIDKIAEDYRFEADKTKMYEAVLDYVMNEHPDLLEGSIQAVTDTLDDYSDYMTAEELKSFLMGVENVYVGIGVTIEKVDEGIKVTEVNENGGAFESGIQVNDIIFEVNGQNIKDFTLDESRVLIIGDEGTSVDLKVHRGENDILFSVVRKKIYVDTVTYSAEEGGVGYIYISEFASSTPMLVEKALEDLEGQGIKKFMIDVRDNPGGTLGSAIGVLELFVPKGKTLTKIIYNNERRNIEIKSEADFKKAPNREIIILVNENSASAAELFSGAMQNLKLAKVLGVTSYGKGSMQEFMGLISPKDYDLGDIKLSVAEFTKPDGGKINGCGIKPDIKVKNYTELLKNSDFTPLESKKRYTIGDVDKDVYAIEERLTALGYYVGEVDEVFDEFTKAATAKFQENLGLHPYGVMDFTTQQAVENEISKTEVLIDKQLETAYDMLLEE